MLHHPTYASASYSSIVSMVNMHEKESQYCEAVTDNMVDSYYGKRIDQIYIKWMHPILHM